MVCLVGTWKTLVIEFSIKNNQTQYGKTRKMATLAKQSILLTTYFDSTSYHRMS